MAKDNEHMQNGRSGKSTDSGWLPQNSGSASGVQDFDPSQPMSGDQTATGDVAPFTLDELAALTGSKPVASAPTSGGQFNPDELEFESFMFDTGDRQGLADNVVHSPSLEVNPPAHAHEETPTHETGGAAASAQDLYMPEMVATESPVQVVGEAVPPPPYSGDFVADTSVPPVPPAATADAMSAVLHNIEGLSTDQPSQQTTEQPSAQIPKQDYPTASGGWTDQLLSSVKDFAQVLLALRKGKRDSKAEPATDTVVAPASTALMVVPTPVVQDMDTTYSSDAATAVAEPPAEMAQPEAAPTPPPAPAPVGRQGGRTSKRNAAAAAAAAAALAATDEQNEPAAETSAAAPETQEAAVASAAAETHDTAMAAMEMAAVEEIAHDQGPTPEPIEGWTVAEEPVAVAEGWNEPAAQGTPAPEAMPVAPSPSEEAFLDSLMFGADTTLPPYYDVANMPGDVVPPQPWHAEAAPTPEAELATPEAAVEYETPASAFEMPPTFGVADAQTSDSAQAYSMEGTADALADATAQGHESHEVEASLEQPMEAEWSSSELPPWLQEDVMGAAEVEAAVHDMGTQEYATEAADGASDNNWLGELAATQGYTLDAEPGATITAEEGAESAGGRFKPDEMEFEPFMFDPGLSAAIPALPNIEAFMPAVRDMEAALDTSYEQSAEESPSPVMPEPPTMAEIEQSTEAVPFWLAEAMEEGSAQAGAQNLMDATASPQMESVDVLQEQADNFDFAELPPIEPFDFSIVQVPEEEEVLGFRTEELLGSTTANTSDPMIVTANLDVLADLIGKDRNSGLLDMNMLGTGLGQGASPTAHTPTPTEIPMPEQLSSHAPMDLPVQEPAFTQPGESWETQEYIHPNDMLSTGWIANTSKLTGDDPANTFMSTDQLNAGDLNAFSEMTITDLNVAPFDIDDLGLEDEEPGTEFLEGSMLGHSHAEGSRNVPTEVLLPGLGAGEDRQEDYWETPEWLSNTAALRDADVSQDAPTARFGVQNEGPEVDTNLGAQPTVASGGEAPGTAEDTLEPMAYKARVSTFRTEARFQPEPEGYLSSFAEVAEPAEPVETETTRFAAVDDSHTAPEPASPNATTMEQASAAYGAAEMPVMEAEPYEQMPEVPAPKPEVPALEEAPVTRTVSQPEGDSPYAANANTRMSGGLAPVEGFEPLRSIVASRPNDPGARMALAVAYAQSGHLEHALYEYRRLLQLRDISAPMLQLIDEQLNDVAGEADGMARFHQLRGDLYMKQGRYPDAIEEYNRVK